MSMAASGKSRFSKENPIFHGYRIVDFAQQLPKRPFWINALLYVGRAFPFILNLIRNQASIAILDSEQFTPLMYSFLSEQSDPTVILGKIPSEDLDKYPQFESTVFGMVLIPEADHRRNCQSRKKEMRNPIPFFHHWTTNFKKIQAIREEVSNYASRHDIPIFDSFSRAITELSRLPTKRID